MKFFNKLLQSLALAVAVLPAAYAGEGQVVSVIDTAGYTYVEVDQQGSKIWLASEPVKVSPGQQISFEEFSLMTNFRSESLQRTFPVMRFVSAVKVVSEKPN